jgi:hypothetical protein
MITKANKPSRASEYIAYFIDRPLMTGSEPVTNGLVAIAEPQATAELFTLCRTFFLIIAPAPA